MAEDLIVVRAKFDPDVEVWFVESSDLPGVNAEAPTLEGLVKKLPAVVQDIFEATKGMGSAEIRDVPIEVIAHAHIRLRLGTPELA
jgi:hypothetical protein